MSEPPSRTQALLLRLGTAGALLAMLSRGGRWWMLPLVGGLLLVAILLVSLQGIHYVAPFIYVLF